MINVIFLDFDGVLDTIHYHEDKDEERRVKILSNICKKYDCKVVIEASCKGSIDEETLETESERIQYIFDLFKKYDIECIGRTPTVRKGSCPIWKEDEILAYLENHPEISNYCVIDDDDTINLLHWKESDLDKVRGHLVMPIFYSKTNPEEEGLLEHHIDEVGLVLRK